MKSILRKFIPGVVLSLVTVALVAFASARAQNKPAAVVEQPTAINAPVPQRFLVCGVCGAELTAPRDVAVMQPANPGAYAQRERSDYGREDRRDGRGERVIYVERDPVVWAPAYYGQAACPVSRFSDPFGEIRVNPIPWEGNASGVIYAAAHGNVGRAHRHN